MRAPDPNDELIREMLERRGGMPPPDGVLDRVMRAAATRPRQRGRAARWPTRGGSGGAGNSLGFATLIAAMSVAILGLLAVIVGLAAPPWPEAPDRPAGSAEVGGATATGPSGATPAGVPNPSAAGSASPAPDVALSLAPDRMAVVTPAGRRLRVRSAPSVGDESTRFDPLLPAGTRLFIVGGPVHADGYTWYQVKVIDEPAPLFGWVATGKSGKAWIRPERARCPDTLDVRTFSAMATLDFLACYGSAEVTLEATLVEGRDGGTGVCPVGDGDRPCDAEPPWMFEDRILAYRTGNGFESEIAVAVPPDLSSRVANVPEGASMSLTVAMDHPDARTCRATDPETGADAAPPDQAVLDCRARFVVQDVTWSQ